jgi:DNA primase small subunit
MPHSVSLETREPDFEAVDMIADVGADPSVPATERQDEDQDMTMAEADVQGEEATQATDSNEQEKQEVKLEDLFADVESDEEFPSSNVQDLKMSSSPEAPASPM